MPNLLNPVPNEEMVLLEAATYAQATTVAASHILFGLHQAMTHPPGTLRLRNLLSMTMPWLSSMLAASLDLEGISYTLRFVASVGTPTQTFDQLCPGE